jgi:hypothetical protein
MPHRASVLVVISALVLACAGCGGSSGGAYQQKPPPPPTPGIDLGKQSFAWLPHPAVAASPVSTYLKLKNFGTDAAGDFRVRYDYTLESDFKTEYQIVDSLAPGAVVTLQTTYMPSVWGTLHVHITIDPDHHVNDANLDNNDWSESITIDQPGGPG